MDPVRFFRESSLTTDDAVVFAKVIQVNLRVLGSERCWCVRQYSSSVFEGFSSCNKSKLLYRSQDARPLLLAMTGRYYTDELPILVRRGICKSPHCMNPSHYYYGTKSDVALENNIRKPKAERKQTEVTAVVAAQMRMERDAGESILRLSRKYKIAYHTARRICSDNTYNSHNGNFSEKYLQRLWDQTIETCSNICQNHPKAAKSYNLAYHVANEAECLWHHKGSDKHKGNFGLMGECLDCMEEIKKGRCAVDVTQFDHKWYWTVKRFWEQVDIKGEDECWPWLGTTRRDNTESIAYFPSPFHSGKTQSAPRVAFWLSRGYTGKYKVFNKPSCHAFCCNPKHLSIREIKDLPEPEMTGEVKLRHTNIFQHHRESQLQNQSGSSD